MSYLRTKLEKDFGIDVSRLSPPLRMCLERLDDLHEKRVGEFSMAGERDRPRPKLIDDNKGRLVEKPDQSAPTPAEDDVQDADQALNDDQSK